MYDSRSLNFEALKSRLDIPAERVVGSTTDLPPKMLGLFYLESLAQQFSRMTGLNCYVPNFVCIRAGEKLAGELPPVVVSEQNAALLREPFSANPQAQELLTQTLQNGYFLACYNLDLTSGLIIRSAGKFEDGQRNSYAGVYKSLTTDSYPTESVFVEIGKQVAMSSYEPAALRYHYFNDTPTQPIDVIAQELVCKSVALNFTVTESGIESVEILGLNSRKVFIPDQEGRSGKLIDGTSGKEIVYLPKVLKVVDQLHNKVVRAFSAEAKGSGRISIECAFDSSCIDSGSCPNDLALLQIRPLPDASGIAGAVDSGTSLFAKSEAFFSIRTHLIPGPCNFDSVILCKVEATQSYQLGKEMLSAINRLREKRLFRPIVVLEAYLILKNNQHLDYILNTIANLPFVGVIDQGLHMESGFGDTSDRSIFAGHVGALVSERLGILVNASGFMSSFEERVVPKRIKEEIVPTEFEKLLASDLDELQIMDPNYPTDQCTELYALPAPMTLEVVTDPDTDAVNFYGGDDKRSRLRLN
jgi:hypothetical protein